MSIRELAAYGRRGDNNLVHIADRELRGLEAITGRKFTKNPHTGLPEAFTFADLIPVAAGIAGTVVSGGNPVVGAAAAGATRAGVSSAQGKSTQDALVDGIMSGATSYASAGLMEGIGTLGAEAAGAPATSEAAQVALQGSAPPAETLAPNVYGPEAPVSSGPVLGPPGPTAAQSYQMAGTGERLDMVGTGIQERPGAALNQVASPRGAIAVGGTAAQLSGAMDAPEQPEKRTYPARPQGPPPPPRIPNMPGRDYRPGYSQEHRYFRGGGGIDALPQGSNSARNLVNEATAAVLGEHPDPEAALSRFASVFGEGAVEVLRDRVSAGRVRGSGGGLDDLVPGDIEGRKSVRLADGEFVVPADVVSHLGDGSTDQGVRRLHEMMDRVRQGKTGSVSQPGPVDAEAMPA